MARLTSLVAMTFLLTTLSVPTKSVLTPTETYPHSAALVANEVYQLYWKYDNTTITFEIHAKAKGWVGFGLSPNGGMANADIVIGWVKDGVVTLHDRWSTRTAEPGIDDSQDLELVLGQETDTHTILKFTRPLITCDTFDRDVSADTIRVIYAFTTTDPTSTTGLSYHSINRGTKSLQLLSNAVVSPSLPNDTFSVDFLNTNVSVPSSSDTTYWCQGFSVPVLSGKHHVVKIEPVIQPGHESLVHHMILYGCYHIPSGNLSNNDQGSICYTNNMPWDECTSVVVAWAIGGGDYYYPDHVGLPLNDVAGVQYFRLETHYDNPQLLSTYVDASGLRLWLTPTVRTHDAGLMQTGVLTHPLAQVLPGGFQTLQQHGHCVQECLQEGFGSDVSEIKVFGVMLHTHLLGTAIRFRHFRNGVELAPLDEDNSYDFNYQETRMLPAEVTIQKGDSLLVECTYSTQDKDYGTFGGLSTKNEMCLGFLMYYPKVNLSNCESYPQQYQMMKGIPGVTYMNYTTGSWTNAFITSGPYSGKLITDYVNGTGKWTDSAAQLRYQTAITTGAIGVHCRQGPTQTYSVSGRTLLIPSVTPYSPPTPPCGSSGHYRAIPALLIVASIVGQSGYLLLGVLPW